MDGTLTQARRLLPGGDGEPASANAFLALTGLLGVVLWGGTVLVGRVLMPREISLTGTIAGLVLAWAVAWTLRELVGATSVDRDVWLSTPTLVWAAVIVPAFAATVYGLTLGPTQLALTLFWAPWAAAFAVGYLATGLVVDRGGVYLLAGVASALLLVVGLTTTVPALPVVLGVLHAGPLLLDAARGDRERTGTGNAAVVGEDGPGGRIPR